MDDLILGSTHQVIQYVRHLLDSQISISVHKDIDINKPILFCANHFTRSETFLMPGIFYQKLNIHVRSLADKGLLKGALGEYLERVGTVSTADPQRNKIILSDLIKAKHSWIIYPEGSMMKNKKVTKGEQHFILHEPDQQRSIYTGAAVLALKSELEKRRFNSLQQAGDILGVEAFRKEYDLGKDEKVSYFSTQIIPVTISYFPIRPGNNPMLEMADSLLEKKEPLYMEELEIEGNLIMHAHMHIELGEPIDVGKYIQMAQKELAQTQPSYSDEDLIEFYRHPLTTLMMDRIYRNTLITFDHIFALIIENYQQEHLSVFLLKSMMFLVAREVIGLRIYKIQYLLKRDFFKLLIDEPFDAFDSILALAVSQGIMSEARDGVYTIDKTKLADEHTFTQIRIKNTLRVILNEVLLLDDLRALVKKQLQKPEFEIKKECFYILYNQDQKMFDVDYQKFYSVLYSKPKEIGRPFILFNPNYTTGVVISHGYKAAPKEVEYLADYLHKQRMNVYAIRMAGHGTMPEDLRDKSYEDWLDSFNRGFAAMRQVSQKLFLCGFSTGALLALITATRKERSVDGVICINTAIEIKDISFKYLLPAVNALNSVLSVFNADIDSVETEAENPEINYTKHYLSSIDELKKLMEVCRQHLSQVNVPTVIIQGDEDPVVEPTSAQIIYDRIASSEKEIVMIPSTDHVIVTSAVKEQVFEAIGKFLERVC